MHWLISLAFLASVPTQTQAQSAVIFERIPIEIQLPRPSDTKTEPLPKLKLSVELRPEDALRLEYIHALNILTPTTGVMIYFAAPTLIALPAMKVYTPVDVAFVEEDGKIVQIVSNVVLGEMPQEIMVDRPIKAFLFFKAGQAAQAGIKKGSLVSAKVFTPPLNLND